MVWVLNKSERAINIGGVLLTPTIPAEIDDSFLQNERVMEIMADGELEKTNAPSSDNKPATNVSAESGQQSNTNKPTNDSGASRSASGTQHAASATTTGVAQPQGSPSKK